MNILNVQQGSAEWLAARAQHLTASEAPAMMGVSKYQTRSDLLCQKATGIAADVDGAKQALFDKGHESEAAGRPLAEEITGDLYPVTATLEVDGLHLLASLDGATMMEDEIFEHKLYSQSLAAQVAAGALEPHYTVQMDQQLLISGARRCLFMTSDGTRDRMAWCWYETTPEKIAALIAGWKQFTADLAAYEPPAATAVVVAASVTALPAVSVQVSGAIAVRDNFKTFEAALREFIETRLIREPSTDQDFADLDLQIKALKNAEAALDAAEAQMLAQVESVDAAKRAKDMLLKLARDNRLMAEKLLTARKEAIKGEIVTGASQALLEHVRAMNCPYLPRIVADFAGAIKNKRTVASLRDAVDTELARIKIEANGHYQRITQNLATLAQHQEHAALFADVSTLVLKAPDDLAAVIDNRITKHRADEAARLERERERIRQEEQARAQREVAAKAQAEAAALRQAEADALAKQRPAETVVIPAPAAPAGILDRGESPAGKALVNAMALPPAPRADEPATLKLGTICERLGFTLTAAFLAERLGIEHSATDKAARLYKESDFPRICAALLSHVGAMRVMYAKGERQEVAA